MFAVLEARLPGLDASAPRREARPASLDSSADEDLALMERVKEGDSDAFNRLMEKHEKTVINLVYRFTGDRQSAEDLAQEVFLRVYRAAGRFQARAKFFTYLYKVTLNLCRNAREKNKRRRHSSLDSPGKEDDQGRREVEDPGGSAEDQVSQKELARVVREAVLSLPEDQKEVVILQRYQGLQYEEVAEALGISVAAVKSRIHRAKLNLKKQLAPYVKANGEEQS